MNFEICAGKTDQHIEYRELVDHMGKKCSHGLQPEVWLAFDQLAREAAKSGINLMLASGFRSFERQLLIWNAKANGERPVLDGRSDQHSVFAGSLIEILENNDQPMRDSQLFSLLSVNVSKRAENLAMYQQPEMKPVREAGHEGGNFFFVPQDK